MFGKFVRVISRVQEGYTMMNTVGKRNHNSREKLSSPMAMVMGAILSLEIMIGGAMLLNFDFKGADMIAVALAFVVLYFGIVAALTDK